MASDYDDLWKGEWKDIHKYGPGIQTRYRILLNLISRYSPRGSLLDSGSGDGSFLRLLHRRHGKSHTYYASDISGEALKGMPSFVREKYVMDLERKMPARKFDIIVSSEVLEHVKDWKKALKNLTSILSPSGYLYITVPHSMRYWTHHDDFVRHYRRFEIGEIEKELKKNGMRLLKVWCWGWPVYWLYYELILKRVKPQAAMSGHNPLWKRAVYRILYNLFFFDDLFNTQRGRRLFIVAQKA